MGTDPRKSTGFFSTASAFSPEVGALVHPNRVGGYYIDFDFKAESPRWPPEWLGPREGQLHVTLAQWALGAYERYLKGEGEQWLDAARRAGDYLLDDQEPDGSWLHLMPMPHTFPLDPPWISGMAQGEGASVLVRLHRETGEERYAEGALRALRPFAKAPGEGGVRAELHGGPFFEEYPTTRPSFVLNGGIFALWGAYDVGVALRDQAAASDFETGLDVLARSIHLWDTGSWSLYDLYPLLPVRNVASSAYHLLHIRQLEAMALIAPRAELDRTLQRFRDYADSRVSRASSFAHKVVFRLVVPRNRLLGRRLPWTRGEARARS